MSDFLSRLAERAIGRGEVVRPRIAPLFADGRSLETPALHEPVRQEQSNLAQPAVIRMGPARGTPPSSAGALDAPAFAPPAAGLSAPMPPALSPGGPGQPATDTEPSAMPAAPPGAPTPPISWSSASDPESSRPRPRHVKPTDEVAHSGPPETQPVADTSIALTPLVAHHSEPAAAFAQRGEAVASRGPAARPEEPVVKVTIGRIDVRAVMAAPSPPSQPAARPMPQLTLEEYVKQRREGLR